MSDKPDKVDPRVTKRRVTMTNYITTPLGDGTAKVTKTEAVDYVRPDFLDAYVADAQKRWQEVVVSDDPDAGPGGYEGETHVPKGIDHTLAGAFFPADPKGA